MCVATCPFSPRSVTVVRGRGALSRDCIVCIQIVRCAVALTLDAITPGRSQERKTIRIGEKNQSGEERAGQDKTIF